MIDKITVIIVLCLASFIGLMYYGITSSLKEDEQRAAERGHIIKSNSEYFCTTHGGVLYVSAQTSWQEVNYIAVCKDGQRFEHLQQVVLIGE